jgi:uncharacterized protein YjeT (DUF2065 family)
MTVVLTALGLVLVLEGVLYAAAPGALKQMALRMQEIPDDALRMGGVAAVALGVLLVWLAKGAFTGS